MKGVTSVLAIRTKYGTYVIRIEARDKESAERIIKKLRLIGIYITKVKYEKE